MLVTLIHVRSALRLLWGKRTPFPQCRFFAIAELPALAGSTARHVDLEELPPGSD
jgi:hypothetical protein